MLPVPVGAKKLLEFSLLPYDQQTIWTSYDMATPEGRRATYNAQAVVDAKIEQFLKTTIEVEHVVCVPGKAVDRETGEEVSLIRVVMVGGDGHTIGCSSDGILKDLAKLTTIFGEPPWQPPLRLVPTQVATAAGRRTYKLKIE